MLQLTHTFNNANGFYITPLYMEGKGFIFLPKELQEQLGYDDLVNTLKQSESFAEGIEYLVIRDSELSELKELLKSSIKIDQFASYMYDAIKFAPSLIVLTESGLYTVMLLSRKPLAIQYRRWVTCDILPSIRKTGTYIQPGEILCDVFKHLQKNEEHLARLHKEIFQQLQKMEVRIENLYLATTSSGTLKDYERLNKINDMVESMVQTYNLSPEEKQSYTTALCRKYDIRLPEKALEVSKPTYHDLSEIAEKLGLYTTNGRPHSILVGALIRELHLDEEKYQKKSYFEKNGHQGVTVKYSERIVPFLYGWLQGKKFPEILPPLGEEGKTRQFRVKYVDKK